MLMWTWQENDGSVVMTAMIGVLV